MVAASDSVELHDQAAEKTFSTLEDFRALLSKVHVMIVGNKDSLISEIKNSDTEYVYIFRVPDFENSVLGKVIVDSKERAMCLTNKNDDEYVVRFQKQDDETYVMRTNYDVNSMFARVQAESSQE